MTPPGIYLATLRLVAQCLNQLRHRVPPNKLHLLVINLFFYINCTEHVHCEVLKYSLQEYYIGQNSSSWNLNLKNRPKYPKLWWNLSSVDILKDYICYKKFNRKPDEWREKCVRKKDKERKNKNKIYPCVRQEDAWCSIGIFSHGTKAPGRRRPPHCPGFTITLRHTTLDTTPLDEWSVRRRDLYLAAHNTHKRQTSMPPAGLEPAIPASERPQTHALDGAATGIGVA